MNLVCLSADDDYDVCLEPVENYYYTEDDHDEPCQRLGDALIEMRDQYIATMLAMDLPGAEHMVQQAKDQVLETTGIDLDQDEDIRHFACQLAGTVHFMLTGFPNSVRTFLK